MRHALILVDLQNDFLPGGALPVKGGDQVIPVANRLQECFEHVIATVDWHPENHGSFAKTHGKAEREDIELEGIEQILWPVHCVQGTHGAELSSKLHQEKIEHFCKGGEDPNIDSYSAFFDNKHLKATGLADYLRERGITHLWVMGLATDFCVKYTVLDALALGFQVSLIRDGCRGIGDEAVATSEMVQAGAELTDSERVLQRFKKYYLST